jgi:alpha-beta hydrolase superfamily lysophospholipase
MLAEINLTPTCRFEDVGTDANPIKARRWTMPDAKFGAILMHGLGAHSGWFEPFAARLKAKGVDALSYDQAGFGERMSSTPANLSKTWNSELDQVISRYQEIFGEKPFFLAGNSMGAMVALRWLCTAKTTPPGLKGLVLFSPGFSGNPQRFTLLYQLKALTTAILAPKKMVRLPYGVSDITRHSDVQQQLNDDPHMMLAIEAGLGFELFSLTKDVAKLPKRLSLPLFLAMAGKEHIVDNKTTLKFYDQVECYSKIRFAYPEAFHDLMFDACQDQLAEDLVSWMTSVTKM